MVDKPVSKMVRYCGGVVEGVYCDAELTRSVGKVDGHYEGVCPICGSFYTNYNGRPKEPKTGVPSASQITESKTKAIKVKTEIAKLRKTHKDLKDEELLEMVNKKIAYAAKEQRKTANKSKAKAKAKSTTAKSTTAKSTTAKSTTAKSTTAKKTTTTAKKTTTTAKKTTTTAKKTTTKAVKATVSKKPKLKSDDIDSSALVNVLLEYGVLSDAPEHVQKQQAKEAEYEELVWDSMPEDIMQFMPQQTVSMGSKFFEGSFEKREAEYNEFPDVLEDVEYETVLIKQPEPFHKGISDETVGTMWSEAFVTKHNLTVAQVKTLLSEESVLLKLSNFMLEGINFNPNGLSTDAVLEQIRNDSFNTLMLCGKTSTQDAVDDARELKASREAALQKVKDNEELVKSTRAAKGLSYNFLSGVMTDEQAEEFMTYGLIPRRQLKKVPPSPERLHSIVNRARVMSTISKGMDKEIELEVITEYDNVWKDICSDICNNEYGDHSYWIAAGTDWFIQEYVNDVIKTAFATGLSVAPMTNLGALKEIFDKSHGYLNDMEFLANSPRAMRDSVERFTMFNAAYNAIYEGAVSTYKPKALEPPRYTWGAYMQSDIVAVQLPETGLVAGGLIVLAELLRGRAITGKATILITTTSLKRLNELNTGLVPALFGQNGISIIPSKDVGPNTYLSPNTYVYHTSLEDRLNKTSAVQKKKKRIESKNKK